MKNLTKMLNRLIKQIERLEEQVKDKKHIDVESQHSQIDEIMKNYIIIVNDISNILYKKELAKRILKLDKKIIKHCA